MHVQQPRLYTYTHLLGNILNGMQGNNQSANKHTADSQRTMQNSDTCALAGAALQSSQRPTSHAATGGYFNQRHSDSMACSR